MAKYKYMSIECQIETLFDPLPQNGRKVEGLTTCYCTGIIQKLPDAKLLNNNIL